MTQIKDQSKKKRYSAPKLVLHGDVDELTKRGGSSMTDMPIGTPIDDDISNVAS